ncbi:MAG: sensor histidine kinase [Sphingobacteriales bacterium]|nr:sensor histidine kinase [Sphingobacteriales bacterium]
MKYKLQHVAFWALVFALWYYLRYQDYETSFIAVQITLLKVLDLAGMIYLTNYFLIPRFLYPKRYALFLLFFILMILGSSVIKVVLTGLILNQTGIFNVSADLKTKLYENAISDFFLVSAGAAFKLIFDYLKMQQNLAQVGKEKAETELNFLKSQINPHFLFNSLNSVYFLINKDNIEARDALHKFSEMLRYQLYEANGDKIPVERELNYLKDYIELQQLRKDEKNYSVQFNCSGNVKGLIIEPLLLIPFVENAFKHLSHHGRAMNFIKLDIGYTDHSLNFRIENSKEEDVPANGKSGGIGLVNVKRRLELLYPGKHRLDINESGDTYSVNLKIQLNGN